MLLEAAIKDFKTALWKTSQPHHELITTTEMLATQWLFDQGYIKEEAYQRVKGHK